ncbi:AAA family ATPase [Mesobacillus thioparans]|uniref:AAA family ATPase n=1 Tax=Mesobacillus thioparans TaxID=370439 RepID=UPI0039EF1D55
MASLQKNKVYIVSGPAGVGKTTTSLQVAQKLSKSAYISGDYVSHMHINGRKKPWESEEEHQLIWRNILSLTKNFLQSGTDVVIDFVTFPKDAEWLSNHLLNQNAEVKYIVLWTDSETLIARDNQRENRTGERSIILMNEFKESGIALNYILETSKMNLSDLDQTLNEILGNPRFVY